MSLVERLFRGPIEAAIEARTADFSQAVAEHAERNAAAARPAAEVSRTAAVELAAVMFEAAFSVAEWSADSARLRVLTPPVLAMVARALVTDGEAVLLIRTGAGLSLLPASGWAVLGSSPDPTSWRYELTLSGPSGASTSTYPAGSVLHFRRGATLAQSWRGCSPVSRAPLTGRLLAEVEDALGDEAAGTRGYLLPIPSDGGSEGVEALRGDLGKLRGKTHLVETTSAGWGEGRAAAPASDWKPRRIGAEWPASMELSRSATSAAVLAALGVPPSLAVESSDGTAQRESFRRWLHAGVAPMGALIAAEAAAKLEVVGAALSFDRLFAADLSGRARAFQSLVGGGMEVGKAAALAGLLEAD